MIDIVTDFTAIARRMKEIQGKPFNPSIKLGVEVGETCNRNGCMGVIVMAYFFTYHNWPPFGSCALIHPICPICGWEYEE